jgi:hypothetical protein
VKIRVIRGLKIRVIRGFWLQSWDDFLLFVFIHDKGAAKSKIAANLFRKLAICAKICYFMMRNGHLLGKICLLCNFCGSIG